MSDRWVCKRCFADNDGSEGTCVRCGLMRGSESTLEDQETWAKAAGVPGPARPQPAWRRLLQYWWIPALAIFLLVGFVTSARRDDQGSLASAGNVSVEDLRPGDCFNAGEETEVSDVDGVPCTESHAYEVFAVADYDADVYPATREQSDAAFGATCLQPFEEYVGIPYADSRLYASMITPSEDGWNNGDREFICYLHEEDESPMTSSMEGAAR